MFKCTDCNKIFEIKPDYCDCGNNTFEEVIVEQKSVQQEVKNVKTPPKVVDPRYKKMMSSFDVVSVSIFGICIFLSILILLFFANPKPTDEVEDFLNQGMEDTEETVNIPKIDDIWNNALPKVEIQEEIQKKKIEPSVEVPKSIQQVENKIISQTPVKQLVKPAKPPKSVVKTPVTQKIQQTKTVTKSVTPAKTASNPSTVNPNPPKQVESPKIILEKYKVSLRNALFAKLNLSKVDGSGLAIVEFSIDGNGKLVNRTFTQQSGNKKLDDAVYNMLMGMPYFNIPPSSYKGEILKLRVTFNYGQYNFDLR